ncbi:hypothetical protein PRIPAC_95846, partial [Pristionchus pacificus]
DRDWNMRVCLILLLAFAIGEERNIVNISSHGREQTGDDNRCRSGFFYREGWCTALSPKFLSFSGAVDYCAGIGAYSPSIHSKVDLDYWAGSAFDLSPRFWLDASCPEEGEPNQWRDKTPTDYMGPLGELQMCTPNYGFIMSSKGFVNETYSDMNQAVCVYPVDPMPEPPLINVDDQYCQCNKSAIELDIVFAADTSEGMSGTDVSDITSTIQSMLCSFALGIGAHQSNVAVLSFGNEVKLVKNFGDINSNDDISKINVPVLGGENPNFEEVIDQASSMLASTGRKLTRKAIVILSKSSSSIDYTNGISRAQQFQNTGGVVLTLDLAINSNALNGLSSRGYNIKLSSNVVADSLEAFCDANCFCQDGLVPYLVPNEKDRDLPMGCYKVGQKVAIFDDAQKECRKLKGFVITIHDDAKNFFLISLFPPKAPHWIGLKEYGSEFVWTDGSNDGYTWWAPGNPVKGLACVYAQQTSGFNTGWFSAPCKDYTYSLNYACQLRPFDAGYSGIQ